MSQLSTFKPTEAGKYAKNSLFQVYDKDSLDHTIVVKSATVSGLTTDVGVTYKQKGTPVGYFKGQFPVTRFGVKGATLDFDLQTDASKASSVGLKQKAFLPQYVSGLSLGLKASTSDKDLSSAAKYRAFGGVTLDYARPNFVGQVAVTTDGDKQTMVTANASVGANGFSVGGDVKLVASGSSMAPKAYNVGAEYKRGAYVAALVSDAKFDKLKATFLTNRVAWKDATYNFGAQAKIDLQAPKTGAPQRELILSVEQVATPQTKYKLAYVATGNTLVAGVEHQPTPAFKLTATGVTSMPSSPFAPFTFTRFGVGAEWNLQ